MSVPEFWNDRARADEKIREMGLLKDVVDKYQEIQEGIASRLILTKISFMK
jgi:hypothetical protein